MNRKFVSPTLFSAQKCSAPAYFLFLADDLIFRSGLDGENAVVDFTPCEIVRGRLGRAVLSGKRSTSALASHLP